MVNISEAGEGLLANAARTVFDLLIYRESDPASPPDPSVVPSGTPGEYYERIIGKRGKSQTFSELMALQIRLGLQENPFEVLEGI